MVLNRGGDSILLGETVADDPSTLIDLLATAIRDEKAAREQRHAALATQARTLRELREAGISTSRIAHRLSKALGLVLDLRDRRRLAARLRKRRWRGTRCPDEEAQPHGLPPIPTPSSDRATPPDHQEPDMAKLIKRTIVEEFVEGEDEEHEQVEDDESEVDVDVDGEAPPRKKRRR